MSENGFACFASAMVKAHGRSKHGEDPAQAQSIQAHCGQLALPDILFPMGSLWRGCLIWAALLFGVRYFRAAPIYDLTPLDPNRRFGALLALLVFLLCFMAVPLKS
jgi:hypothetical protein